VFSSNEVYEHKRLGNYSREVKVRLENIRGIEERKANREALCGRG
jgi:hypothetical protein